MSEIQAIQDNSTPTPKYYLWDDGNGHRQLVDTEGYPQATVRLPVAQSILGVRDRKTVYRLISEGKIKARHVGRIRVVVVKSLLDYCYGEVA